jgi:hypothetical protein
MAQYIVSALREGRTIREDVFESPSMEVALACAKDIWAYLGAVSWQAVSGEDNPARVARILRRIRQEPPATAIKRMWINQPSALQPHHALHGTRVLAVHEYNDTYCVFFLSGDTVNQQITKLALSEGWP